MGELYHEKARGIEPKQHWGNDDAVVPTVCEVSFNFRIPDHIDMGGWEPEAAIEAFCLSRGWGSSDRIERRGPKAKHVHIIYLAPGRYEAVRRGVKGLLKQLESVEEWNKAEIALDVHVIPLLY